jgi:uncharacterized protein YlxP (DUF503 family)
MVIGCCSVKFYLHGNLVKRKKTRCKSHQRPIRNYFNVSVAEVGDQGVWQSLHIAISAVGSNRPYIDVLMSKVVDAIDRINMAKIVDCKTETLNMGSGDF